MIPGPLCYCCNRETPFDTCPSITATGYLQVLCEDCEDLVADERAAFYGVVGRETSH